MKKILIACLMSIFVIFNLTGCKSEDNSNRTDKKDLIGADSKKESENKQEDKNDEEEDKEDNDDKEDEDKKSSIIDYLTEGKFDAVEYVESCLDFLTKGETKNYIKTTKRTKEQAELDYENNLDAMVESMGVTDISAQLKEDYKTFYKELYKKAKYNVKSAEKMSSRDGYTVLIEFEQITGLFDGIQEELMEKVEEVFTEESSLEDVNEIVFQAMLDIMNQRLDKITYSSPKSITVEVVADNSQVYSITDKGYKAIQEALISTDGLE